jgi:hypothetical protein
VRLRGLLSGAHAKSAANPKNPTINPTGCARFAATPWDGPGQNILTRQWVSSTSGTPWDPPKSYSRFCTCSRICSISSFSSIAALARSTLAPFRAQRVGFAIEFLHQEIEPLSDRATGLQDALELVQVHGQARQLLGHVDAHAVQHHLLADPVHGLVDRQRGAGGGVDQRRTQALDQPGLEGGEQGGRLDLELPDQLAHALTTFQDALREPGALALAAGD